MTPVVLLVGLALVAVGGLAWVTSPLLRVTVRRVRPRSQQLSSEVQRSLDLMTDLDLERSRGAISDAEHAELTAETRRQAALELGAQEQRGAPAPRRRSSICWAISRQSQQASRPPRRRRRPAARSSGCSRRQYRSWGSSRWFSS